MLNITDVTLITEEITSLGVLWEKVVLRVVRVFLWARESPCVAWAASYRQMIGGTIYSSVHHDYGVLTRMVGLPHCWVRPGPCIWCFISLEGSAPSNNSLLDIPLTKGKAPRDHLTYTLLKCSFPSLCHSLVLSHCCPLADNYCWASWGLCTHDPHLTGWVNHLLVSGVVSPWIMMHVITCKNYNIYRAHLSRTSWCHRSSCRVQRESGVRAWPSIWVVSSDDGLN
jgi:hypothetical protein